MKIGDIIGDAIRYPLNDKDKFIYLAIPNFILGLLLAISSFLITGYDYYYYSLSYETAEMLYSMGGFLMIITVITAIIVILIDSGISIDVVRNTINQQNILPELEVKHDILMGLKSSIVTLIYMCVPIILYCYSYITILGSSYYYYYDSYSYDLQMAAIVLLIAALLAFIIALFMPAIFGKLAMTNSIGEALQMGDIYNRSKQIGFGKLFLLLIATGIINAAISSVGTLIEMIPIIGYVITFTILYTYIILFLARCYGLIYNSHLYSQYQYSNNQQYAQYNNQQYNYQNANQGYNQYNYQHFNQYNTQEPNQNYNPGQNIQQNTNPPDYNNASVQMSAKTCMTCGYVNPPEANNCMNCGKRV